MAQMKLIPADNVKDKLWGKRGTPEREAMETELKEDGKKPLHIVRAAAPLQRLLTSG